MKIQRCDRVDKNLEVQKKILDLNQHALLIS